MVGTPLRAYDSKIEAMVVLLLMKKMMKREVSLESSNEGEGLDVGLTREWGVTWRSLE